KSVEDMIKAAIEKGGSSLGFSEHSDVLFDPDYSMTIEDTPAYIDDVRDMQKKYDGEFDVFLGLEVDYFTDNVPSDLDYIIGSVHHVFYKEEFITVDGSANHVKYITKEHFKDNFYKMAEVYYETLADVINKTNADIVAHFDLVAKHNANNKLFDDKNHRYVKAALAAMDSILEKCKLFEVNTGAMFRLGNPEPYPSAFLLKELCKRGGEVILSSDSHKPESLYYKFDEVLELVKSCGFKHIKRLTKDGFIDVRINNL
ncbi:MAG: histidinol-phosphatase HisJ family protein, partial [Oscillospiraceae bacterium]|nr:histidinol-phosphatase HisJ family protein [Oscillospiraceae bacterium]